MPDAIRSDFQPMSFDPDASVAESELPMSQAPASPCTPAPTCSSPKDEIVDAGPDLSSTLNTDWAGGGWDTPAMAPKAAPSETTFSDAKHSEFPTSNGFPIYRQGDSEWADQKIGTGAKSKNLHQVGCAMSSAAMAMSKLTGTTITPATIDAFMKANGGMNGNKIADWKKFGQLATPPVDVNRTKRSPTDMLADLRAGKPVVFGVNYTGGTDTHHWLLATGIAPDGGIMANDPATGNVITFELNKATGKFECASEVKKGVTHDYVMTGDAAVFTSKAKAS